MSRPAHMPSGDDGTPASAGTPGGDDLTTPLWPFRLLALAGALLLSWGDLRAGDPRVIAGLASAVCLTGVLIARPTRHNEPSTPTRIVIEHVANVLLVMLTGSWPSPFAIMLIPTTMLAGFAAGTRFALSITAAASTAITLQHLAGGELRAAAERSLLWTGLLALVAFTCGLAKQAGESASHQREEALARVSQLSEANALLFALQRLAQTMPASLDLDEIVDSTLQRVGSLAPTDVLGLYLTGDSDRSLERYRAVGGALPASLRLEEVPPSVRSALEAPRTVLATAVEPGSALSANGRSGVYAALQARGSVVGLLVLESEQMGHHDQQAAEIVHGLAEPFGIAIDNARLFRRIRVASADEERSRIARDLHDRVGSSLAFLGFEIDRAQELAGRGDDVAPVLGELRSHLTDVIRDVRETLHDLRSDVSEQRSITDALRTHLERVTERSSLAVRLDIIAPERLTPGVERELWRLALEAITNVERHARATELVVRYLVAPTQATLVISDNGVGLNPNGITADRYGMIGMRERAAAIGAVIRVESAPQQGTTVTVVLDRTRKALR